MNRIANFGLITLIILISISCDNSVKLNNGFSIEYMDMFSSISLRKKNQGFLADIKEAYWNKDSLVVSSQEGCFLIIFEKTEYNDEMIKIDCHKLNKKLKKEPINNYQRY